MYHATAHATLWEKVTQEFEKRMRGAIIEKGLRPLGYGEEEEEEALEALVECLHDNEQPNGRW